MDGNTPGRSAARAAECAACLVGKAAGEGRGGRCPMADRPRPAGTWLYIEGERADKIWYVKRGVVVLSRLSDDSHGNSVAWAVRPAGSLLGMEGLVRNDYLDSARAVTDVVICAASRDEIRSWLDGSGSAACGMLDLVLLSQDRDAPRPGRGAGSADARVSRWLLENDADVVNVIPRAVIADLLGMLPETFSRALASLSARGAISVTRRSIRILNAALLRTTAEFSPGSPPPYQGAEVDRLPA